MKTKKPNFFIVGAPKCGTTALAKYLSEHKDIFITDPKEPHFFATDLENYRVRKTTDEYLSLFENSNSEKIIGEASVFYLYSKIAIENIYKFNSNAKIVVMLRNPIEMVPSIHAQLIVSADENIRSFKEAWQANGDRKKNINISKTTRESSLLYYDEIAKYAEQIERLKIFFPENQIKIILFEDFKNDTKKVYEETLDFLDITQNKRKNFPKINENEKIKNIMINSILRRPPSFIVNSYLKIKKIFGLKKRINFLKKLNSVNSVKEKRERLSKELKKEIIDNYKEDILSLGLLLNKDLKKWMKL